MEVKASEFEHNVNGTIIAYKTRNSKRRIQNEIICYECGCRGEIIQCDICPKSFHIECIGDLNDMPGGAWHCPWHFCSSCGLETETVTTAGYYCVNCPKSFCNSCSEKWESAISSAPDVETFSSLRRNGFTLKHPDSRLFVCPECLPNTDIAVNSCYRHAGIETVSSRKIPFKISSAIKHKKLQRSSDSPSILMDLSSFQKLEVIFRNKVTEKQLNAVDDRNRDTFDLMGSVSIHESEQDRKSVV